MKWIIQYKMLDAAKNFGKVTVSTGYNNIDTVIVLDSGDGDFTVT